MTREELKAAVLTRIAEGGSYGAIARELGVTRNVVNGVGARAKGQCKRKAYKPRAPSAADLVKRAQRAAARLTDIGDWDAKVFEPYAVFKLRKALERHAVRP